VSKVFEGVLFLVYGKLKKNQVQGPVLLPGEITYHMVAEPG